MKIWPLGSSRAPVVRSEPPLVSRMAEQKFNPAGAVISAVTLGQPIWTERNFGKLSSEGYERNAVVHRCVKLIAAGAANVPWLLTNKSGRKIYDNHPLLDLLQNPGPGMVGTQVMEAFYAYLLLAGNSYLAAPRLGSGRPPRELWNLRPDRMEIIGGRNGLPEKYKYEANGQRMYFVVDPVTGMSDVLHVKDFHPTNDWYGMSRLEPGAYGVDRHNAASRHAKALLDNGARPSGAMVFEPVVVAGQAQAPSQNVIDVAERKLKDRFSGPDNAGQPMVLSGNIKWQEMSINPRDMDFARGKEDSARDICYALGVPDILIVPGQSTYNNISEAKLDLWEQTILPTMGVGLGHLNNWLVPQFGDDLKLGVDLDQVSALELRRTAKRKSVSELYRSGIIDADEARQELDYGRRMPGTIRLQRGDGQIIAALMTSAQASHAMVVPLYNYMVSVGLVDPTKMSIADFTDRWDAAKDTVDPTAPDAVHTVLRENSPPGVRRVGYSPTSPSKAARGPRPIYVSRPVLNGAEIAQWAKDNGVQNVVDPTDMHVTIAHSRAPVNWDEMTPMQDTMVVTGGAKMDNFNGHTVLRFENKKLESRWRDFRVRGASWDHPSYNPHVTVGKADPAKSISGYTGDIVLGPESFDELMDDADGVTAE